ncbi:DegT/DnrJ/EryC1/StrS family aminotransferase [Candidatus Peregrinibacteria bacterium]|nr:DegT/DnrJ/EryC1/StrS family aminotransferase [Candidatus Peregrinibacteria bacterium]
MPLPIHHTFGPHADRSTALAALRLMFRPWNYRKGLEREMLRSHLHRSFGGSCALFASGRDGLLALLRALHLPQGSEVILQGFTCVALPNAIHAAGLTPVYADIDPDTLNFSEASVLSVITHRTKVILCQHTFGIICDTAKLRALCDKHRIVLIEDCAHVLPDVTGPKEIGKHADVMMLSFGRDKAISGVAGGAILVRDPTVASTVLQAENSAQEMRCGTVCRLLLYPIVYRKARALSIIGLGTLYLWLLKTLRILVPVLTPAEKRGAPSLSLTKMPNACAALALREIKKIHTVNNHRRILAKRYSAAAREYGWHHPSAIHEDLPLQKFPILVSDADAVRAALKENNIHLDDGWTGAVVCPRSVDQQAAGYTAGSCPHAERIAKRILTLPTHPTMTERQAETLIDTLQRQLR